MKNNLPMIYGEEFADYKYLYGVPEFSFIESTVVPYGDSVSNHSR